MHLIEYVQRNFTRRICPRGVKYNERLRTLKLKSLEERRVIFDLKTLFKVRLNDNVASLSIYFILFHLMRCSNCYQNIFTSSSFVKSIWFYRVIKLPCNIKQCNIYSLFCNHLIFTNFNYL